MKMRENKPTDLNDLKCLDEKKSASEVRGWKVNEFLIS